MGRFIAKGRRRSILKRILPCAVFLLVYMYWPAPSQVSPEPSLGESPYWSQFRRDVLTVREQGLDSVRPRMTHHAGQPVILLPTFRGFPVLLQPEFAEENTRANDAMFVIFVQSNPRNIEKRNCIRRTWANVTTYTIMGIPRNLRPLVIFTLGIQNSTNQTAILERARNEATEFNDVVMFDFVDSYDNLTLKGLLTMKWISTIFPNARHVFKTDDDVTLNIVPWMSIIQALEEKAVNCVVVGLVWKYARVDRKGRYVVAKGQYMPDHYPSFCSGSGYLMSRDALLSILDMSMHMPQLLRDDPFFTGIAAEAANVTLLTVAQSYYKGIVPEFTPDQAEYNSTLLIHNAVDDNSSSIWHKLTLQDQKPSPQNSIKLSYVGPRPQADLATGLQQAYHRLRGTTKSPNLPGEQDGYYPMPRGALGRCSNLKQYIDDIDVLF